MDEDRDIPLLQYSYNFDIAKRRLSKEEEFNDELMIYPLKKKKFDMDQVKMKSSDSLRYNVMKKNFLSSIGEKSFCAEYFTEYDIVLYKIACLL